MVPHSSLQYNWSPTGVKLESGTVPHSNLQCLELLFQGIILTRKWREKEGFSSRPFPENDLGNPSFSFHFLEKMT